MWMSSTGRVRRPRKHECLAAPKSHQASLQRTVRNRVRVERRFANRQAQGARVRKEENSSSHIGPLIAASPPRT